MEESDLELVGRIRRGDATAFTRVVDRYSDDLYALGYSLMGSEADARDVVQETLLGAFRRIGSFEGRSSLKTWLLRILFNQASKARRSRKLRRTLSLTGPDGAPAEGDRELRQRSPAASVEAREDVAQMLEALPQDYRRVIVLRELEQLSYQEIGDVLGIPIGTVESRLYRARQELKRRFEGYLS